jgi:glutaredoxin
LANPNIKPDFSWHVFTIHLLILAMALSITPVQAGMYKWVDEQGITHYGDKPPIDGETQEITGRISSISSPEVGELPEGFFERSKPASRQQVTMYSAAWCSVCKTAKSYFQKQKIAFTEYDIDTSDKGKRDFKQLGGRGVPVILIGKNRMNGFSAKRFEQMYAGK